MFANAETAGRLVRFTFVGLGAMAAYAVVVTLLALAGVRPQWLASGLAYAIAAIWSYVGHRRFSFRSDAPHAVAGPRFIIVTLTGQALAIAIPALVTDIGGRPAHVATLAVCIVCPAVSFILNGSFVFADRQDDRKAP
jgi:putative flippase GtrA